MIRSVIATALFATAFAASATDVTLEQFCEVKGRTGYTTSLLLQTGSKVQDLAAESPMSLWYVLDEARQLTNATSRGTQEERARGVGIVMESACLVNGMDAEMEEAADFIERLKAAR